MAEWENTIKELQEQIEEAEKEESGVQEEESKVEDKPEEAAEAEKEEEKAEAPEETKEEEKPEEKAEEDDAKGPARLRIEAKRERERADRLSEELAALKAEKEKEAPEEEKQEKFQSELTEVIQEVRTNKAAREFLAFEDDVRNKYPEYEAISQEYTAAMRSAVRLDNPRLSPAQIQEVVQTKLLQKAGHYARQGYDNPVEALLDEARSLGFTGASVKKAAAEVEESAKELKPDLKKVASNRQRSAGTAAASGESKSGVSRQYIADHGISGTEWMKLSPEEKRNLMFPAA